MSDESDWRFCEIIERTEVPGPTITAPPQTSRVVLEQHTRTGEYRTRPLKEVLDGE